MKSRDEVFGRFVERWVDSEYLPAKVNHVPFDKAEKELGLFPAAYREFILRFGWVQSEQALIDAVISSTSVLEPICHFFSPIELAEEARSLRRLGLKRGFVPIATNGGGDYFCLKPTENWKDRNEDGPVYFFLHEEKSTNKVAASFEEWLRVYADLNASEPA